MTFKPWADEQEKKPRWPNWILLKIYIYTYITIDVYNLYATNRRCELNGEKTKQAENRSCVGIRDWTCFKVAWRRYIYLYIYIYTSKSRNGWRNQERTKEVCSKKINSIWFLVWFFFLWKRRRCVSISVYVCVCVCVCVCFHAEFMLMEMYYCHRRVCLALDGS